MASVDDPVTEEGAEEHSAAIARTTEVELAPEARRLFPLATVEQAAESDAALQSETVASIEAGIASLLAAMAEGEPLPGEAPLSADGHDDDGAMMALLDELDRLWRDDPEIGAARLLH